MMTPDEIKQVKSHYEVMPMGIAKTEVICLCDTALALWEVVEAAKKVQELFKIPSWADITDGSPETFTDLWDALKKLEVK